MAVTNQHEQGTTLAMFAAVGGTIALLIFLAVFITSQQARTADPRQNLKIPIPEVPLMPTPTPRTFNIVTPESSTPSAEPVILVEPSPEEIPLEVVPESSPIESPQF